MVDCCQVKPSAVPVLGFTLSIVLNIFILITFYEFGLLPASFCDKIMHVQNF
jgi:hypothetical protein